MAVKLHYVFDPMCGWCYAASPLLAALNTYFGDKLELVFRPGLLYAKPHEIEQSFRERIISADLRIAQMSNVVFGDAYIQRVRTAPVLCYHSEPPAAAILAVQALNPTLGLRMLEGIQIRHYQQGKDVRDFATLQELAQTLELDTEAFEQALKTSLESLPGIALESRNLMRSVGGHGFPTLVIECDGEFQKLDHESAYGEPGILIKNVAKLLDVH